MQIKDRYIRAATAGSGKYTATNILVQAINLGLISGLIVNVTANNPANTAGHASIEPVLRQV